MRSGTILTTLYFSTPFKNNLEIYFYEYYSYGIWPDLDWLFIFPNGFISPINVYSPEEKRAVSHASKYYIKLRFP